MRGFIVLCFAAVAFAAPQGYNYSPVGGQQQNVGFSSGSFHSAGAPGSSLTTVGGSTGYFQGAQQPQGFFGQAAGGHQQQHHQQHQLQQHHQQQHQQQQQLQQQQQAVVSKRFYIHTAPEESDDEYRERLITVGVPRKNYNVVFIKSPQHTNRKAAIKISPAFNEEKTVIYVLNKKTDSSDIQAEVIESVAPTSKPEVFFIKYKTNEEAVHAQQQIQAQYDSLGGSSQVLDEGVAPVTSVIGSLGGGDGGHGGQAVGHAENVGGAAVSSGTFSTGVANNGVAASHATNNAYLPPSF